MGSLGTTERSAGFQRGFSSHILFFFLTCIIAIARPALSIPHGNLVVNMQEKADTKIFHFDFSRQVSYIEGKNGCGDILRVCSVDML